MITLSILFIATLFLAYSNGANDNFKGVATLFGSGTTNYKAAITWATISTFAGSITSLFLAETLLKNFSGRELVPNELAATPQFVLAVGLGAGLTVMLATLTGFPISTTHGLVGALAGAGVIAIGTNVNFATLGTLFFLPLLASPLLAVGLGVVSYVFARGLRVKLGVEKEWCVCVGESTHLVPIPQPRGLLALAPITLPEVTVGPIEQCRQQYKGKLFGGNVQRGLDSIHFLSAGSAGFARGLNDTPKIGLITREANRRVVSGILMSWVLTLPIAAILSAAIYILAADFHG